MKHINLDKDWTFRRGFVDSLGQLESDPGVLVNLPHDGMISTNVSEDAPALYDSGYFNGDLTNYTKYVDIPKEWENDSVGLSIDGAMMNVTIDVNGGRVCAQHYGYAPFYVDLTDYVTFGEANRITINTNTTMQPNSRWYTGSGLYRGVELCHGPKVHIVKDGIYVYTKDVSDNIALLEATVEIKNQDNVNRIVEVVLEMSLEESGETVKTLKRVIQVNKQETETARIGFYLENPVLWDVDTPNLYTVKATVINKGVYRTHFVPDADTTKDEASTLFGIRTITADSLRGLRINGKTVKLKGGCLHHDNGLLGSVSLYETEARKVKKLKEVGFNAIRTTHNPPSKYLIEACDRLGLYVFDEAFDAWGMGKRAGDYSQFFENYWEKDLTAFVKRDRSHPSVIIWSTGNEIPERGGLNNGYTLATKLAEKVRSLDGTRPVSNGICSLWSGLDDELAKGMNQYQNAAEKPDSIMWEHVTEPFTNGLDIVGYNYYEDGYEKDHEMFPDRVILGSENFPKEIGFRWPLVERLPYAIGDFTWTAWDYLGEAGIGKALYVDENDPFAKKAPWDIMPPTTSPYPWRTANDADIDITGRILPQGNYRSVVWGSEKTYVFSMHPDTFGKIEKSSMWGFPVLYKNWSYKGYENKPVELVVYSGGDEVELFLNGKSLGKKPVSTEAPWPKTATFDAVYEAGEVVAVSYKDNKEISRDCLKSVSEIAALRLVPEKESMSADGHDLIYVNIEVVDKDGFVVPDAAVELEAVISGPADLSGFGSGNPKTDENYTDNAAVTFRGYAQAVLRSQYEKGEVTLTVKSGDMKETVTLFVK